MKKLLALLLAVAMVLSLVACTKTPTTEPTAKPTAGEPAAAMGPSSIAVCLASEPDTIDPALNSAVDGATLVAHLFSGLAKWAQEQHACSSRKEWFQGMLLYGHFACKGTENCSVGVCLCLRKEGSMPDVYS